MTTGLGSVLNVIVSGVFTLLLTALAAFLVPSWRKRIFRADAAVQEATAEQIRTDTTMKLVEDVREAYDRSRVELDAIRAEAVAANARAEAAERHVTVLQRQVQALEERVDSLQQVAEDAKTEADAMAALVALKDSYMLDLLDLLRRNGIPAPPTPDWHQYEVARMRRERNNPPE